MSKLSGFVPLQQAHRQAQCGTQCITLWQKNTFQNGLIFQLFKSEKATLHVDTYFMKYRKA
jgi:hypothetical protein